MSTPTGSEPPSDDFWAKRPETPPPPQPGAGQPGAGQPGAGQPAPGPGQPPAYPQPGVTGYPTPGGQPGWAAQTAPPRNGLGIAALVLGILSIPFALSGFLGIILGAIGLILGIVALNRAKRGEATNRGVATAGTVLSALGVVFGIAMAVLWTTVIVRYWECIDPNEQHTDATRQACFDRIDRRD